MIRPAVASAPEMPRTVQGQGPAAERPSRSGAGNCNFARDRNLNSKNIFTANHRPNHNIVAERKPLFLSFQAKGGILILRSGQAPREIFNAFIFSMIRFLALLEMTALVSFRSGTILCPILHFLRVFAGVHRFRVHLMPFLVAYSISR